MTTDPPMTSEQLDEVEGHAKACHWPAITAEVVLTLVAMARKCLRWDTLGESPAAVREAGRMLRQTAVYETDVAAAEIGARKRLEAERDELAESVLAERNRSAHSDARLVTKCREAEAERDQLRESYRQALDSLVLAEDHSDQFAAEARSLKNDVDKLRAGLTDIRSRITPTYGISTVKLRALIDRLLDD